MNISDALNQTSTDLGYFDGVSIITLNDYTGNETIGLSSGDTVDLDTGPSTVTDILTLTVDNAATGTADVLNIGLDANANEDNGVLAIANVETINIDVTQETANAAEIQNAV